MKVAVCGLGRMGSAFAEELSVAGHEVTVWNRTPRPAGAGIAVAAKPAAAAAGAEAVVVTVFDGPAAGAVLSGPDGVIAGAGPGTLVINATTLAPDESREYADQVRRAGLRYLEAPVVGSVPAARAGSLLVLTGGEPEDARAAQPVLHAWSHAGQRRHVGPVGSAAALKLVANLALGTALAGLHDAVHLGAGLGLDREAVLDVLQHGAFGGLVAGKRGRLNRNAYDEADFTVGALVKDLGLASRAVGDELPAVRAAARIAGDAVQRGDGDRDISVLGRFPG